MTPQAVGGSTSQDICKHHPQAGLLSGEERSGEGRGGWPWGPELYMESPTGIQVAPESVLKVDSNGNPLQYSCLGNPMDRGAWDRGGGWGWGWWFRELQSVGSQRIEHG